MTKLKTYYVLIFTAVLSSCAPQLNLSVTDIQKSKHQLPYKPEALYITYNDPEMLKLSASDIKKNIATVKDDNGSNSTTYSGALHLAIDRAKVFTSDKEKDSIIVVNMHPVDRPILSATFPCKLKVDYVLKSTTENKDLLQKTIETEASVPWDYHFLGAVRSSRSTELAAQKNIKQYVEFLIDQAELKAQESKSYQSH